MNNVILMAEELHSLAQNLQIPAYLKNDVLHSTSSLLDSLVSKSESRQQLLVANQSLKQFDHTLEAFDICERILKKKSFHLKQRISHMLELDRASEEAA